MLSEQVHALYRKFGFGVLNDRVLAKLPSYWQFLQAYPAGSFTFHLKSPQVNP